VALQGSLVSLRDTQITGNQGFGVQADENSVVAGRENVIATNGTDLSENVPERIRKK